MVIMISISVAEASSKLSQYIKEAQHGEEVIVCNRNIPVIRLTPIGTNTTRVLGSLNTKNYSMSEDFNDEIEDFDEG